MLLGLFALVALGLGLFALGNSTREVDGGGSGIAAIATVARTRTPTAAPRATRTPAPPGPTVTIATAGSRDAALKPSRMGELGNTRADVYAAFGEPDQTEVIGRFGFADYGEQLSFGFRLSWYGAPSGSDRMMDIMVYAADGDGWSLNEAAGLAESWLPPDAVRLTPGGQVSVTRVESGLIDYRLQYRSAGLASVLPYSDIYFGEDPQTSEAPGTIWVRLETDGADETRIDAIHVTTQGC